MSLAYQRAATPASGWDAWGTLVFGTTRIALRKLVVFGGIALLILTVLIRTGEGGIGQLWASALFGVPLLVVGSLTRTVGLLLLGRLVLIGAAMVGVMYLLALIVISPLLEFSRPRDFVVPALEQLLVMAPLIVLVWRWRAGRAWSLGATDLLLAGTAVGIGFALVEESYIRNAGADAYLAWLPVVAEDAGRIVGGHPVWAGLGGATLGLGLFLRSRGPMWLLVAASGSVLAFVDHAAHNNVVSWGDELAELLNLVTLSGWLPVVAFLALAAACIGADLAVQRRLEPLPHRAVPPRARGLTGLREAWEFVLARRGLAIADFHSRRLAGATGHAAGQEADDLDEYLYVLQPAPSGKQDTPPSSDARAPASASDSEGGAVRADEPPPPTRGTPDVSVIILLAIGLGGALAALASQSAGPLLGSVALTLLDVGANCDPACLASGAGGAGGSGGPSEGRDNERDPDREKRYREQQDNFRKFDDWLKTKSVEESNWQPREERIRLYNEYKEGKRPWPWPHGPERIRRIDASQTTSSRG